MKHAHTVSIVCYFLIK